MDEITIGDENNPQIVQHQNVQNDRDSKLSSITNAHSPHSLNLPNQTSALNPDLIPKTVLISNKRKNSTTNVENNNCNGNGRMDSNDKDIDNEKSGNKDNNLKNLPKIKDKKGRSTSCFLCQRRKQKCDQRSPSCTNCIKAKIQCIQPPRYGENNKSNAKDEYTIMLEKRVKQLEKILDDNSVSNNNMGTNTDSTVSVEKTDVKNEKILKYRKISQYLGNNDNLNNNNDSNNNNNASNNDGHLNHFEKLLNKDFNTFLNDNHENINKSIIKNYSLKNFLTFDPILNLDSQFSKLLIDIYFALLQYKFPLLNESEILQFHNDYYNKINFKDKNDYHFKCCRMFLIYAISALLYKSTGRYRGPHPFRFFSTALRHSIFLSNNLNGLEKIEILILFCFFLIRTDKDSTNLYLIVTDAMRSCMELNLHKSKTYKNISNSLKDQNLRKFWCCYLLEKSISISIGKPFILKESKIDKNLPLFDYNSENNITFINQSIKIRRIEAKFIEQLKILSSVSMVTKNQLPQVQKFFQELQEWRNECQDFKKGLENETLSLYYYKAIRTLIQPFLELLDPEDKLFKECQAAAGQICQSIKSFHHKTYFGFSILNVHSTFIAGITLIYCLWLQRNRDDMRRKLLGDDKKHTRPTVSEELFSGLDDLRACSISLYVMSERTKFALSFRDTFEEIMHATIGNLILRCGPDSSEIIYRNEPGMPPAIVRKPLNYYQLDSSFIQKTPAEKMEDEERSKRKGFLTRSTIPKGLSHLLLHPPGNENGKIDLKNFTHSSSTPNSNPRLLPPPINTSSHLPLPNQSSRLSSSLTNSTPKSIESDNHNINWSPNKKLSISSSSSIPSSSISAQHQQQQEQQQPQKITTTSSEQSLPLPLPFQTLSPLYQQHNNQTIQPIGLTHNNNLSSTSTLNGKAQFASPSNHESFPSPNYFSNNNNNNDNGKKNNSNINNISSMSDKMNSHQNVQKGHNIVATPESANGSVSNGSSSSVNQTPPVNHPIIPELYPFVGRTTNMISNISVWTEESGQQIPQTGLNMIQQQDPNAVNNNSTNNITTSNNNTANGSNNHIFFNNNPSVNNMNMNMNMNMMHMNTGNNSINNSNMGLPIGLGPSESRQIQNQGPGQIQIPAQGQGQGASQGLGNFVYNDVLSFDPNNLPNYNVNANNPNFNNNNSNQVFGISNDIDLWANSSNDFWNASNDFGFFP